MSGEVRTGYEDLDLAQAEGIDAACDRFEAAWRAGLRPAVEDYLAGVDAAHRPILVRELVLLDAELRRRAGEAPAPHDYRGRFSLLEDHWLERAVTAPDTDRSTLPSAEPAGPPPTIPGYVIVSELGRGGMGVVYQALDTRLGRFVALKFLNGTAARDPQLLERFRREARAASALNHPAVCTLHDLGEHDGRPFLVLEYVEGHTLRALTGPPPDLERLLPLVRQVAEALRTAHAAGVVHRDIKPENLMVRPDGYVKVLDFGLARLLSGPAATGPASPTADTDPGTLLGTVLYMSPEQARTEAVGSASDIFSLGVVLYELLTGRHPFDSGDRFATLHATATAPALPPARLNPEVPAALEALTLQMLAKDPRLRPTAAEVEAVLAELAGRGGDIPPVDRPAPSRRPTVGRDSERAALRAGFEEAVAGRGTVVCVTGEAGLGKTTLVENFLAELAADGRACCVARGRCSERLGGAEAYQPMLEALDGLLRGGSAEAAARTLRLLAPSWHAQVAPPGPLDAPDRENASGSPERMKRELFAFLQELTRLRPVVIFLDDVHWADVSTVDLFAYLAGRGAGLRLLFVLAYRPTELLLEKHPLRQVQLDLLARGACREVPLRFLDRGDVDDYLGLTFPGHAFPADFAALIHARTEGNPLFMAELLRDLGERGAIAAGRDRWELAGTAPDLLKELPESVRGLIQRKLDRLGEIDRRLLDVASVQGYEFDSAALAEVLRLEPADVEERLQALDHVHSLVRLVREQELPGRTLTLRYGFVHVLYQNVLYFALPPSRRAAWSAALAEALLRQHGEPGPAVAAELACLFETARDYARAADFLLLAAQNAARVFAHQEAVALARRGLRLLQALPDTPERSGRELALQMTLGMQLQVTKGFAAPPARQAYTRARELCRQAGEEPRLFPVLWGLWLFHKVRSELTTAREMADELFALGKQLGDAALVLQAHQALAVTSLCLGEPRATVENMERGMALYDPRQHHGHTLLFGQDPGVACRAFGAVALWLLGYPDRAVKQSRAAVRASHELAQPSSQALALHFAAMLRQCRREPREALTLADLATTIAAEQGFSFWHAGGTVLRGWALADAELLRQGLTAWQATGSVTYRTYYLALRADVLLKADRAADAAVVLAEALDVAQRTSEGLFEAELHRLQGEVRWRGGSVGEAEACFRRAIDVARGQGAKSLELRAALSLTRLLRDRGRGGEGRRLLTEVFAWFTEGADTADHGVARELLRELA